MTTTLQTPKPDLLLSSTPHMMPTANIHQDNSSNSTSSTARTSLSSIQYTGSSLGGSTSHTVNTISTNNTLNSLNHHHIPLTSNDTNMTNNGNSIPNGYSVHIKASERNGNSNIINNSNSNNNLNKMNLNINMNSNQFNPMNVVSSSLSSSPTPSSTYNTSSLPTLTSSESLSAFNMFDNLNSFPIIGGSNSNQTMSTTTTTTIGSPFANALFNTNPVLSTTTTTTSIPLTSTNIVTDETVAQIVSNTSVPEFLYQLTKMLTDDHRDIIEWSNGKIEVHNPTKLEKEVLNQYFRHSKYASFQRQLNYFGFRKLAGKGKMAPCSYVNENATSDLRSLLRMKRKTSATAKDGKNNSDSGNTGVESGNGQHGKANGRSTKKSSSNKRARTKLQQPQFKHPHEALSSSTSFTIAKGSGVKHKLNGYLAGAKTSITPNYNMSSSTTSQISSINNPLVPDPMTSLDPLSIAKSAVGKGVTHQYHSASTSQQNTSNGMGASNNIISGIPTDSSNKFTFLDPSQLGMGIESCLSELQNNFRNSLNEANAKAGNNNMNSNNQTTNQSHLQCSMQRESSLVDLAIIPSLSSILPASQTTTIPATNNVSMNKSLESDYGMTFIDFPLDPSTLPPPED
jgi:hypothetical protein